MRRPPPRQLANFDSAAAFVRATSRFLRGKDFPAVGLASPLQYVVPAANALPRPARELLYALGGIGEAWPSSHMDKVSAASIARWAVGTYESRRYPAVMVGSSSGALVHLCAALGTPWLPQTAFMAVSQTQVHPDDARDGLEAGLEPGRQFLERNPDVQLHHMHDPNQDRLMLQYMTYFRIKRLVLGDAYEAFLERSLPPGGIIIQVECRRKWPVTRVGDRHVFQFGALGGATEEEFLHGSERVSAYLERYQSHRTRWDPPEPNDEAPEAEWGFEPALAADIARFAEEHRFKIVRLIFEEPEDLSPFVADLYRWWYARRRIETSRLLVGSFMLLEPWWTLRTGSIPFWMKFNMDPSAEALERYLEWSGPFDYMHMILFSHGVDCVGLTPIERWREILGRARKSGEFAGVDEDLFPRDFAVLGRYHRAVRAIAARYPMPAPLSLFDLAQFVQEHGHEYPVEFEGLQDAVREPPRAASAHP
jgi:hypothetical protein